MKISKDMKIEDIIKHHPQTLEVFQKFNIHCIGCAAASFETLEQGAAAHGIDIEELVKELNKAIE
ncbi:MAG: DUF1858 domain-containing protein [Candidatus Portnoybacteria bacterium]|nr:DUF1858 domain-containing protein [Candidatus Portnoybacteria bacterium]